MNPRRWAVRPQPAVRNHRFAWQPCDDVDNCFRNRAPPGTVRTAPCLPVRGEAREPGDSADRGCIRRCSRAPPGMAREGPKLPPRPQAEPLSTAGLRSVGGGVATAWARASRATAITSARCMAQPSGKPEAGPVCKTGWVISSCLLSCRYQSRVDTRLAGRTLRPWGRPSASVGKPCGTPNPDIVGSTTREPRRAPRCIRLIDPSIRLAW